MEKRRKKWMLMIAVVMVFWSTAGMTGAYMTYSPQTLKNRITPGSIEVELTETKWVPEKGQQLVPESEVMKNPAVTNTGKNPAWIFLKVQIPRKELVLVDPISRRKQKRTKTELFSFDITEKWELVECESQEFAVTYVYGFQEVVESGDSTTELFEKVKLVNFLEGEISTSEKLMIPVDAMAIQTNVCEPGAGLTAIYEQYLRQKVTE